MKTFYLLAFLGISFTVHAQRVSKVSNRFPLSGNGKWDYLTIDKDRLFVSHGEQVQVINKTTGKEIASIKGLAGVHGIAIDAASNHGFISNGKGNNVIVFDNTTYAVLDSIATAAKPDAIVPEPYTQTILTGNGEGNSLSIIDPSELKVAYTIALEGNPEWIVSDKKGKVFVNIENKSEIAVIDMKALKVDSYIHLAPEGEDPTGLAIDTEKQLLFAGCSDKKILVIDIASGKVIAAPPIGEGCDGIAYSAGKKYIYAANRDGTLSVIHQKSDGSFEAGSAIKTQYGAKTLVLDEPANVVYTAVSHFLSVKNKYEKRTVVPGTFKVLVIK